MLTATRAPGYIPWLLLLIFTVAVIVFGCTPRPSYGCNRCGRPASHCVLKAQAVVAQPVFAHATFNYFIGADIAAISNYRYSQQRDPLYQEFMQWRQQQTAAATVPPRDDRPAPVQDPPAAESPHAYPYILKSCATANCHAGPTPKAGLSLDGDWLTPEQANASQLEVLEGRMPPKEKLTAEARGGLLVELTYLAKKKERPANVGK